ncbi:MAG: hypothetical protein SGJ19_17645 [Planctomycetia bacterium]|nr:hypothetical protein [Planctomycetia bacterium]
MKPRFSILALIIVTTYAAVFAAAVSQPRSVWLWLSLYLAALLPFLIIDLLMQRRVKRRDEKERRSPGAG